MSHDEQHAIYRENATDYHALVMAEDARGELRDKLAAFAVSGSRWLEVGAGTGRATRLLLERDVAHVHAFDQAAAMLEVANGFLSDYRARVTLEVADAQSLPVADALADGALAAWVFGHFRYWMPADWKREVNRALDEMHRAVKVDSPIVVIETLGTGEEHASAPSPELEEYYAHLEAAGFTRAVIRTDYAFASREEAERLVAAFFGEKMLNKLEGTALIEWTGVWSTRRAAR